MRVAFFGQNIRTSRWLGEVLSAIEDRKRTQSFNISYGRTSLNIKDDKLDETAGNSSSPAQWTPAEAQKRADELEEAERKLLLVDTPQISNNYWRSLLRPITHAVLITARHESDEVDNWKSIIASNNVELSHHIGTKIDNGDSNYLVENDVMVMLVYAPVEEVENKKQYRFQMKKTARKVATDLIKMASDD